MSIKVRLQNVRLAFAHQLFVPSAVEEGKDPKYGCDSLLVPGHSIVKAVVEGTGENAKTKWVTTDMKSVLLEVANDAMKGKGGPWLEALENSKRCYRNGDLRVTKSGDPYEGYEGIWYVAAKNKARPTILDVNKQPLTQADGRPYSGCYGNVLIEVYAITDPKRKGVHAAIKGVQFVKDGDAFGGGAPASPDDFDELDQGAAAADLV
jgi:hypothetical protein